MQSNKLVLRKCTYKVEYKSQLWGNRPMTLGRLLREAPFTEAELEEKERKRKIMVARLMNMRSRRDD